MKIFYKTSFCCFISALVMILMTNCADAQMQFKRNKGNFTSFTSEKTYTDIAKLTALTPLKYRNHPDFGKRVNDSTQWYEQINKRSLKSRTFIGPDNEIIKEFAYDNINFIDEHGWVRAADIKLKPSLNGWSAQQQETPVYLYTDASTALSLGNKELMVFNKNVHFNQQGISVNNYTVGDNGMYITNIAPNTDKIIKFGRGGVETDYTIKQAIKLNGDLIISEDIILPSGYIISENTDEADENGVSLVVLGPGGKMAAEIRSPYCYDSHYNNSITGSYHFQKQAGGYKLEVQISSSWLNDPLRQYPVTIDPLITGPVTKWTGGKIPSCLSPSYGSGTIIDTVPAGITITHCYVQGSWYTPVISKKYLSETFVTSCGSLGPVTVSDTTKLPGVAYGIFDAHQPLTCCINPSCPVDTFSVTMRVTRDSGGNDCDTTQYGWYDPYWATYFANSPGTFESYVLGRTVQDSSWSVSPTSVCANQCSLNLSATVYFGVPPYIITHPWSNDTVSFGSHLGCIVRGTGKITLNIPNCPGQSCKNDTNIYVPPPTIRDACGNVVIGLTSQLITIKKVPDITTTPDTVCSGANVNLALSSCVTGSTYGWSGSDSSGGSTNPINDTINNNDTVPIAVTYTVTTSADGCSSIRQIIVIVNPVSIVTIEPQPANVCSGQSITLNVPTSGSVYIWSPVSTLSSSTGDSVIATPIIQTTYTITGKDSLGCTISGSDVVSISPAPDKPTIKQNDSILTTNATQGIQWSRNDTVIPGATTQNYTITIAGWYKVVVVNPANGCSATSDSTYFTPTGINQLSINNEQLSIYPNPTTGEIFIGINTSEADVKDWSLQITDVLGRKVYTRASLKYSNALDLSNLSGSVYFITVINKTGRAIVPVVKQ